MGRRISNTWRYNRCALVILIYCKKYKVRAVRMFDFIAPALILAQSIGRWGSFFNSEAHGAATTLEHLQSLHIPSFYNRRYENRWNILYTNILI